MDRLIGIEKARAQLGALAEEVARGGEPVTFSKRGETLAVLIGREEYARLKALASRHARAELAKQILAKQIEEIRRRAAESGITEDDVAQAIAEVRSER
jgi:prevent-host-death family protein